MHLYNGTKTAVIMDRMMTIATAAAILMGAVSCDRIGGDPYADNPYKSLELSTRSAEFARTGNTFSMEFLSRIDADAEKDYIISPLSMQFLLGMLLDGARGTTADEICSVLGYGEGQTDAVNEYCLSMLKQLPALDKQTKLSIANAIFVDDGWPLLKSYKDAVGQYYRAEVENLDFMNGPASLRRINGWCSDNTNGLVPKVLDEVDPNMLAYLLNAIYFKSQWKEKFPKGATSDEKFTFTDGSTGKVRMMKLAWKSFAYAENDVFQAVRLPYGNGAYSMTVLLPRSGHKTSEIPAYLKKNGVDSFIRGMFHCDVDLWLPKFETKYHIKLNDILSAMGMPSAFDDKSADFKAMSDYALCLSFVQQDAVIKVDEEGTEAAAVSAAGMMKATSVGPGERVVFHADHPFIYLITENSTGAVLFAGRYGSK